MSCVHSTCGTHWLGQVLTSCTLHGLQSTGRFRQGGAEYRQQLDDRASRATSSEQPDDSTEAPTPIIDASVEVNSDQHEINPVVAQDEASPVEQEDEMESAAEEP